MLKVCGLTKRYGSSSAIENVNFHVESGEIVGLIGHNGCGKSTTMNIITGYLAATEGKVYVDGQDSVLNVFDVRKKIGYLPDTPPLYLEMTVNEQLSFACDLKGIKDKKSAIEAACIQADIKNIGGRLLKNLSKGYRQRIGLAQAFLGSPQLLILDEPSSGLDPYQTAEMRDILIEASKKQSILLSSHLLTEVSAICDRVVVMSNGRVVEDASPSQLQKKFSSPGQYYMKLRGNPEVIKKVENTDLFSIMHIYKGNIDGEFTVEFFSCLDDPVEYIYKIIKDFGYTLLEFGVLLPDLEKVYFNLTKDKRYELEVENR